MCVWRMLTEYMHHVITAMVWNSCNVIVSELWITAWRKSQPSFSYDPVIHEKTSTVPITLHNKSYVVSKDNKKTPQKLLATPTGYKQPCPEILWRINTRSLTLFCAVERRSLQSQMLKTIRRTTFFFKWHDLVQHAFKHRHAQRSKPGCTIVHRLTHHQGNEIIWEHMLRSSS